MKPFEFAKQSLSRIKMRGNVLLRAKGFTLIEMMIAVAISAMIAALAYTTLDSASSNSDRTKKNLDQINSLDRTWQIIGQDLRNLVVDNNQSAALVYPFKGASQESKGMTNYQVIMQFERRGWLNPLGRLRSDLELVNYRVAEGKLFRDFMPQRNKPMDDVDFERESAHQLLLKGVQDIQLRFLSAEIIQANGKSVLLGDDYNRNWDAIWPSPDHPSNRAPVAVEITLDLGEKGKSVRLFDLPQT